MPFIKYCHVSYNDCSTKPEDLVRLREYFVSVSCYHRGYVLCFVRAPEFLGEMAKNDFFACLKGALLKLSTFS